MYRCMYSLNVFFIFIANKVNKHAHSKLRILYTLFCKSCIQKTEHYIEYKLSLNNIFPKKIKMSHFFAQKVTNFFFKLMK